MKSFIRIAGAAALAATFAAGPAVAQDVPGVTTDTIKIGVHRPDDRLRRDLRQVRVRRRGGGSRTSTHAAASTAAQIEVVREDDGCDAAKVLAAFKKVVAGRGVAINGFSCSGVAVALRTDIEKSGVPVMIMGAASGAVAAPVLPGLFSRCRRRAWSARR
jgi:branched-chain amino acid transport system substrate-binding protein